MKQQKILGCKIINRTNQVFQIIGVGYLFGYGELLVPEVTTQMLNLEKKGLITIRKS